jgi:hypothetical protein
MSRISFDPRKRARIHQLNPQLKEVKPKSLLRRESRKEKDYKSVADRLQKNAMIEYLREPIARELISTTYSRMKAETNAFSEYFKLDEFEKECKDDTNEGFHTRLKKLWKDVLENSDVEQRSWIYSVNREKKFQTLCRSHEWVYCMKFNRWWDNPSEPSDEKNPESDETNPKSDEKNPMVEWFYVRKKDANTLGVFARRQFEKDEVVAVFFEALNSKKDEKISRYALNSPYGIIDPLRGIASGGKPAFYMAMHEACVTYEEGTENTILLKNMIVRATKVIKDGDEIIIKYDKDVGPSIEYNEDDEEVDEDEDEFFEV